MEFVHCFIGDMILSKLLVSLLQLWVDYIFHVVLLHNYVSGTLNRKQSDALEGRKLGTMGVFWEVRDYVCCVSPQNYLFIGFLKCTLEASHTFVFILNYFSCTVLAPALWKTVVCFTEGTFVLNILVKLLYMHLHFWPGICIWCDGNHTVWELPKLVVTVKYVIAVKASKEGV